MYKNYIMILAYYQHKQIKTSHTLFNELHYYNDHAGPPSNDKGRYQDLIMIQMKGKIYLALFIMTRDILILPVYKMTFQSTFSIYG